MQKIALVGMVIGFAIGVVPTLEFLWRAIGWVLFVLCAIPVLLDGIRRKKAAKVEGAGMLANDPPDLP